MYKQLDFSKTCRELNRDLFDLWAKGALEDTIHIAREQFCGYDLPFFPFLLDTIGKGTGNSIVKIVEKAPVEKPKKINSDKLMKELDRCMKELEKLNDCDAEFYEGLKRLIEIIRAEVSSFPEFCAGEFEEIYQGVMRRVKSQFNNNKIDGTKPKHLQEIMMILESIFKVHRTLRSAIPLKTFGKYFPVTQKIELYKDTIESEFENDSDRTDFLLCVFAHELFHRWHHGYILNNGGKMSTRSKNSKAVIESLARRFEYVYACNNRLIKKNAREKVVKMTHPKLSLFPDNPYHGAQYIDNDIFGVIIKLSAVNMADAFCVLNAMYLVGECNN